MHKKCEINRTKIKGGCQSGRKVLIHDSKSDLPLKQRQILILKMIKSWFMNVPNKKKVFCVGLDVGGKLESRLALFLTGFVRVLIVPLWRDFSANSIGLPSFHAKG